MMIVICDQLVLTHTIKSPTTKRSNFIVFRHHYVVKRDKSLYCAKVEYVRA